MSLFVLNTILQAIFFVCFEGHAESFSPTVVRMNG